MRKLLSQIIAAAAGLWLAELFVPGVEITPYPDSNFFGIPLSSQWQIILVLGVVLGLLNYFLKPLLKIIALPLELITLGLFTIVINMALIWFLGASFDELNVPLVLPLLYTTVIIWALGIIINFFLNKHNE